MWTENNGALWRGLWFLEGRPISCCGPRLASTGALRCCAVGPANRTALVGCRLRLNWESLVASFLRIAFILLERARGAAMPHLKITTGVNPRAPGSAWIDFLIASAGLLKYVQTASATSPSGVYRPCTQNHLYTWGCLENGRASRMSRFPLVSVQSSPERGTTVAGLVGNPG